MEKIAKQLFIEDPMKLVKFEVSALLNVLDPIAFFMQYEQEILNLAEDMADIDDMSLLEYVIAYFPDITVTEDNLQDLLIEIYLKISAETGVPIT